MREIYHRTIATLYSWWRVLVNYPKSFKWNDPDLDRKTLLMVVRRGAESRYYHKHAIQQDCGCYAIGNHFTSYVSTCRTHMGFLWDYREAKKE